ncbi:MAG: hypothetical protein GEV04_20100 [Actinophytocola sp.]|nr:hypothetical protein [Actinophytocola sp.]
MITVESGSLRPEIAESWRRVTEAGLAPDTKLDRVPHRDFDRHGKLVRSTAAVLDDVVHELQDTSLSLVLTDRDSRIIDTRYTDRKVGSAIESIGVVPGNAYAEDITGTNAIATPRETRRGLLVHGEEHFLEALKKFSCYGLPIVHPVTRRFEGVLDITGVMPRANPLFVPLVRYAVRDIERRLLESSSRADKLLLAAFQNAAKQRSGAVVMIDDDLVLTNPAAVDLLQAADHAVLRTIAPDVADAPSGRRLVRRLRLASGRVVKLEAHRIEGTSGTMFHISPSPQRGQEPTARRKLGSETLSFSVDAELVGLRDTRSPVLISGEPGSGRSHAVRVVAGDNPVAFLDAGQVASIGEGEWGALLDDLAATHDGVVAVEEIQLLPAPLCVRLGSLLARSAARLVLTSVPRDDLDPHVATLAASCVCGVELPPLRRRHQELPRLVHALVREHLPDASVRFAPSALAALAARQWPGNLRELSMVVRHTLETHSTGDITVADLPETYRSPTQRRPLTPLEQAEHDTIVAALRATAGNKRQAAEHLGIGRTTLYRRIRELKITV